MSRTALHSKHPPQPWIAFRPRKGLLCIGALLLVTLVVSATADAATLALGTAQAVPGGAAVTLPVVLTPEGPETVTAFQFDVSFDNAFIILDGIAAGPTAADAGKSLNTSVLSPGNVRAIVSGINRTAIATGTAALLTLHVIAGASGTLPVALSNVILSDANGSSVPVTITGGSISTNVGGRIHTGDLDGNHKFSLSEVLRLVQFYNLGAFQCAVGTEDGYAPFAGDESCNRHDADYNPHDWKIGLAEILRIIQFYNLGGYVESPAGEDGFVPIFP